jgi:hypothetical protein
VRKFKGYICDGCSVIHKTEAEIRKCRECGEEICDECSSFDDDYCEDCYDELFCDENEIDVNNRWRYSNYESKDISYWDEDDHLAAWYDHMMEK